MARPVGDLVGPGERMAADDDAAAIGDRRAPRLWPSLLLVGVFVVGAVLVTSVVLVRGRILDPDLYTTALVETDAYERVYTQVLADPELADLTDQLLGDLVPEGTRTTQVRTLAIASLRLAVPPSLIREGTETVLRDVLAYVRGDTARLDGEVDVSDLSDRVRAGATNWVQARLAAAREQVTPTVESYRAAVADYAASLAAERVPPVIPIFAGTAGDAEASADVLLDRFGPVLGPDAREQVRATALAGDGRAALLAATDALIATPVAAAVSGLRSDLEDGRRLDVIAEVADRAARPRNVIVGHLNTVRDAARWLGPPTAVVGAALMAAAAAGIAWRERRDLRRAGLLLAAAAIASGLVILLAWAIAARAIDAPLAPATTTGPGTWNLPAGVRSLVADVESALAGELVDAVRRLAVVPLVAGAALAAGIVLASRLRLPSPRRAVAAGATAATVAGVVAWALPAASAGGDSRACNGHPELCDRRYDEVVHAATHNAMASPDVVRIWPEQDGDLRSQLDAGVRALLIDTHHWTPVVSADQLASASELPLPPAVSADLFSRLGSRAQGREGIFLCHNQCALGGVPFGDALRSIGDFLAENPDEVVTLIIQDAVSPDETAAAFAAAHLDGFLHHHELGTAWATLGELIDRGERLVVFAEDEGPPPVWYHQAFDHMQDTPYQFASVDAFDCTPNRGDPDAPLLLVNHWVSRPNHAPDRATAARANAHDVLVDRARACQQERGRMANYLAVDFSNVGDLMGAVDTLNGVGAGTAG
jgi:hypothetical protein